MEIQVLRYGGWDDGVPGVEGLLVDGKGSHMAGGASAESVEVIVRRSLDGSEVCLPWERVSVEVLASAAPWRTFRWHKGQKHYSGSYWAQTERDHVIYESRLELARLLFADFDRSVSRIVAQPFLLTAKVGGADRKHIPDYLLLTVAGPVVVDVKPWSRLSRREVSLTFSWTRAAVEARGWRYEVWSEPEEVELANVRFLAGFRRDWLFDPTLVKALCASDLDGLPLGEACDSVPDWPEPLVRSALFHLLWIQHFTVDLTCPISARHTLVRKAA